MTKNNLDASGHTVKQAVFIDNFNEVHTVSTQLEGFVYIYRELPQVAKGNHI